MDVGVLKTKLYFETDESMVFTVIEGGSLTENGYSERVEIAIAEIRPQVWLHGKKIQVNSNTCGRP